MSDAVSDGVWQDAALAAMLFAVDPDCGLKLRAPPGPPRDAFLALLRENLPAGTPIRRLPLHAADDRLLGGLDLAATLRAARPVASRGLLAEADGGIVLVAMAERVSAAVAARLGAVLDSGEVVTERNGLALRSPARIGLVALDEGIAADERPPSGLCDRLAFQVDLTGVATHRAAATDSDPDRVRAARSRLAGITLPDEVLQALCVVATKLGVASLRALLLAARVARAAASLAARPAVSEDDAIAATRLVLAPRATMRPDDQAQAPPEEPDSPGEDGPEPQAQDQTDSKQEAGLQPLGEILLDAAAAALPAGLLDQVTAAGPPRTTTPASGRGATQRAAARGRPIGVRGGELHAGARLNLVETLRAAAPWQGLRQRAAGHGTAPRVLVQRDDFRMTRFQQRSVTTTIFLVDASGSAAVSRLAEAKGAVELLLADCYIRRDRVALIAFRGTRAELLLPPTSSLVRAKRSLAGLPGGGGTPLATGLDAALALSDATRRKGHTPIVIMLSDGRANISRDGRPGRGPAEAEAREAGRGLRAARISCVLIDTSPRPAQQVRELAAAMGARYLPLPYADATALSRAVRRENG